MRRRRSPRFFPVSVKHQMAEALKKFLLGNLVASLAEERGKGEFGSRSKASGGTVAYRLTEGDKIEEVNAKKLRPGTEYS